MNQNQEEKKKKEKCILEDFLGHLEIDPKEIIPQENPDFVLKNLVLDGKNLNKIGIEVTEFYNDVYDIKINKKGSKLRKWELNSINKSINEGSAPKTFEIDPSLKKAICSIKTAIKRKSCSNYQDNFDEVWLLIGSFLPGSQFFTPALALSDEQKLCEVFNKNISISICENFPFDRVFLSVKSPLLLIMTWEKGTRNWKVLKRGKFDETDVLNEVKKKREGSEYSEAEDLEKCTIKTIKEINDLRIKKGEKPLLISEEEINDTYDINIAKCDDHIQKNNYDEAEKCCLRAEQQLDEYIPLCNQKGLKQYVGELKCRLFEVYYKLTLIYKVQEKEEKVNEYLFKAKNMANLDPDRLQQQLMDLRCQLKYIEAGFKPKF